MKLLKTLLSCAILLAAITACGNKGALYLPPKDTERPAVADPAEDDASEQDENENGS